MAAFYAEAAKTTFHTDVLGVMFGKHISWQQADVGEKLLRAINTDQLLRDVRSKVTTFKTMMWIRSFGRKTQFWQGNLESRKLPLEWESRTSIYNPLLNVLEVADRK